MQGRQSDPKGWVVKVLRDNYSRIMHLYFSLLFFCSLILLYFLIVFLRVRLFVGGVFMFILFLFYSGGYPLRLKIGFWFFPTIFFRMYEFRENV